jgi:predicted Zn-dependent peptidase
MPRSASRRARRTLTTSGLQALGLRNAEDLQAATLQEITDFFEVYYAPNNAVLAVVGDFRPAEARAKIENHFQHIRSRRAGAGS